MKKVENNYKKKRLNDQKGPLSDNLKRNYED